MKFPPQRAVILAMTGFALALTTGVPGSAAAETAADTEEEVAFDESGDEIPAPSGTALDSEEEVNFDEEETGGDSVEEVSPSSLNDGFFFPEYDFRRWLVGLPLALVGVVIWNLQWRPRGRRKVKRWPDPDGRHRRSPKLSPRGRRGTQ